MVQAVVKESILGRSEEKGIIKFLLFVLRSILGFVSFVSKGTVNLLNLIYNFKSQERKGNKFVTVSLSLSFLALITIAAFNVVDVVKEAKLSKPILEKKLDILFLWMI